MKTIKIITLTLDHFKGADHLELSLDGKSASLYGGNGAGKTTVYDAWLWLITGKDSLWRVADDTKGFSIKPLDSDGTVLDNASHSSVAAVLDVDGQSVTLRREYYEKWTRKRGAAEASYDGNTTDYYINDVPKSKREFEAYLDDILPAESFRLLSHPAAFAQLEDSKRRGILFEMADVGDERSMMAKGSRFDPLYAATERITLSDYQRQLAAQRKRWNKERSDLPARIDEVKKAVADLQGIPFDKLRQSVTELETEQADLDRQIAQSKDNRAAELRVKLGEIKNEIRSLELANQTYRAQQKKSQPDIQSERTELNRLEVAYRYESDRYHAAKRDAERSEEQVEKCRDQYLTIKREPYPGSAICPTCGQELPPEKQAEARTLWDTHQKQRLDVTAEEGNRHKKCAEHYQKQAAEQQERMIDLENRIAQQKDKIADMEAVPAQEITDMPDYRQRHTDLHNQHVTIKGALEDAERSEQAGIAKLREKRSAVADELSALRSQLAQEATLKRSRERETELREQLRNISAQMEDTDRALDLIEQFTRYKAEFVTDTINHLFRLAEFRLFRTQVNGGLVDCCDILCGGVPYDKGLNTGAKINVGLDMIRSLSEHYGVSVPIFVDNAESVTHLEPMDVAQIIRLVVSEDDRKLRLETV